MAINFFIYKMNLIPTGYDIMLVLLSIFIIALVIILFISCKKKNVKNDQESLPKKSCACSHSLMDIDAATDGFKQSRIIGRGRLGTVYAAVMTAGEIVAVKRIHPGLVLSNAGFGFSSVLKWLSLADHPNVVPIIGYSEAPGERIIVMEYEGMLSLEFYLHEKPNGAANLDWVKRLNIAAGIARGIEYLHEVMSPHIVHGCIKPSNILIDVKFGARICDYGLHFLAQKERQKGLMGYIDKEYWVENKGVCKESDVYGFGVVLLELLSGRKHEEGLIVEWALPLIKEMKFSELLDPRLVIPIDIKPICRLAKVALACVGNSRNSRPPIVQVAAILNNLEITYSSTLTIHNVIL